MLLFPTPPLPLAIARTRAVGGISVSGASAWARFRAVSMVLAFCSGVISIQSIVTPSTPGSEATFEMTSFLI
ncbi:unannotated protein [freshwater metagenome]|uniref:Unannotated protein n=1 Tax=freshwater metagenome TaxID=449393 RepID=A0A6J7DZE7_9ZZZZ